MPLIESHHIDLYLWLYHNLRLPITDFKLKSVERYFGLPRVAGIETGADATQLYLHYLRTKKQDVKETLLAYNREDVEGLIDVAQRFSSLLSEPDVPRWRLVDATGACASKRTLSPSGSAPQISKTNLERAQRAEQRKQQQAETRHGSPSSARD
jgi:hypothetical protein